MILGCPGKSLTPRGSPLLPRRAPVGLHPVCPQHRRSRSRSAIWSPKCATASAVPMRRSSSTRRAAACSASARRSRRTIRPARRSARSTQDDREAGLRAAWLMSRLHAFDLPRSASPSTACRCSTCRSKAPATSSATAPMARSRMIVTALGRAAAEGLMAGGVLPVMKHIPGHGRAFSDTHLELPTVDAPLDELQRARFRAVPATLAASADGDDRACHLSAPSIPTDPATTSRQGHRRDHPRRDRLRRAADERRHVDEGAFWGFPDESGRDPCGRLRYRPSLQRRDGRDGAASRRAPRGLDGNVAGTRADARSAASGERDGADERDIRAEFASYFDATACRIGDG